MGEFVDLINERKHMSSQIYEDMLHVIESVDQFRPYLFIFSSRKI